MKKTLSSLVALMCFSFFIDLTNSYAQSGCCKVRDNEDESWIPTNEEYEDCKENNDSEDGDRVSKPSGKFWWDLAC